MSNFVIVDKQAVVLARREHGGRPTYTLETAAELAGVHPEIIRYYCRLGVFHTLGGGAEVGPAFDDDAIYEIRRIEHYRRHYGVNRRALPMLSRLLREVARLEAEIRSRGDP